MKSLCLFIFSILVLYNMFDCSNKIKKLRINSEEILNENLEKISKNTKGPKNTHFKEHSVKSEKRITKFLNVTENMEQINNSSESVDLAEPKLYKGNCLVKIHNYFFNLNPISLKKDKSYSIKTKEAQFVDFNICSSVPTDCTTTSGLVVEKQNCRKFADIHKFDKRWELLEDKNTNITRLLLTLPYGESCGESGNYTIKYDIECDMNQKETLILNGEDFNLKKCENTIKIKSKYACRGEYFKSWFKRLGISKYIIGSILGFVGLFFVFFGSKYFKTASFIIITVTFGLMFKALFSAFIDLGTVAYLLIGVIIAILSVQFISMINTLLSIIIGFFTGHLLYNFTIKIFDMDPLQLYWTTVIVCIVLAFLFSFLIESLILVITTSLIGSYCAVRGLSIVLGGFPDESYLSKLLVYKEFNQVARIFGGPAFIYLVSIVLLFLIGLIAQAGINICCGDDNPKESDGKTVDNEQANVNEDINNFKN